jgi:frataxin-like iron-binding protein CyaY
VVVPCPSATLGVGSSSSSLDKPSEKVGKDLSRNADSLRAPDPSETPYFVNRQTRNKEVWHKTRRRYMEALRTFCHVF